MGTLSTSHNTKKGPTSVRGRVVRAESPEKVFGVANPPTAGAVMRRHRRLHGRGTFGDCASKQAIRIVDSHTDRLSVAVRRLTQVQHDRRVPKPHFRVQRLAVRTRYLH